MFVDNVPDQMNVMNIQKKERRGTINATDETQKQFGYSARRNDGVRGGGCRTSAGEYTMENLFALRNRTKNGEQVMYDKRLWVWDLRLQ